MERQLTGGKDPKGPVTGELPVAGGIRHYAVIGLHTNIASKNRRKMIPPESARVWAEDDSSADYTETDPGMNKTTRIRTSITPEVKAQPGPKLQRCNCGWAKVTSLAGLRIHQGRKKCLKAMERGPRIDHYFLRSKPNQSSEVQQQDNTHSLQNINTPITEEESNTQASCEPSVPQVAAEKKIQGRRPMIKWPKSCEKSEWETVNTDLCRLLDQLKGPVGRKFDKMGELIYNYGAERFGVVEKSWNPPSTQTKSRRQQEIDRLVKERRILKKQWRKAAEEEREGINVLQVEIKSRLVSLRRAENLRKIE